ncbi:autoinducer synthesis protein [Rhizobium sp. Root708]|uniref:acyl-homoserine-lactone synthase n=1 Tax=Rhizobium sp. Root708 TaxID=1736592 RepID=UPI0006FDB64D|nr:acyl-homoserine-lactone synthase TraI [Rhizobium sp. Root708]KRB49177.1 autoinducer synthesis protein [Rhizobium sp. Root708]
MRAVAVSGAGNRQHKGLIEAQHRLRAQVFSDRLGWDVNVRDGVEIDAFDALHPTYIITVASNGEVVGCARLLPATGPTMAADVFSVLLPKGKLPVHARMIESSRFCVNTSVSEGQERGTLHQVTLTMFAAIIEWCLLNGYTEIVTVTDLRFERILSRAGWPLRRLGEPHKIGATMALAGALPVNRAAFETVRPANYHSDVTPQQLIA